MFISSAEINDQYLQDICNKSYAKKEFHDIIPVKKLGSAFIAELFHGPTFCFKDFGWERKRELYYALLFCVNVISLVVVKSNSCPQIILFTPYRVSMRPAINLLSHFAKLRNRATTILVSTTGKKDTTIYSFESVYHLCPIVSITDNCATFIYQVTLVQRQSMQLVKQPTHSLQF